MKFTASLAILSLTAALGSAYAAEMESNADEITAYCTDQAALAGIEDAVEKQEYMQECIDSYVTTSGDSQPAE